MAKMGKTAVKKWGFDAQKRVIGLEKLRAGNQTRRAKWCKMGSSVKCVDEEFCF